MWRSKSQRREYRYLLNNQQNELLWWLPRKWNWELLVKYHSMLKRSQAWNIWYYQMTEWIPNHLLLIQVYLDSIILERKWHYLVKERMCTPYAQGGFLLECHTSAHGNMHIDLEKCYLLKSWKQPNVYQQSVNKLALLHNQVL